MARIFVVAAVLVVVGLLANQYLIRGGDAPPVASPQSPTVAAEVAENQTAETKPVPAGRVVEATPVANGSANADLTPAAGPTEVTVAKVEIPADVEEKVEDRFDMASIQQAVDKGAAQPAETVLLGTPELTDGIPGEGQLTAEQLQAWLADPDNHVELNPELPLGLAAGAGKIQGLEENPLTRAKIELGRQLYFDPRLSSDGTVSCASCHAPEFGYAKDTQFGVGVDLQEGNRNSPTAYNRIVSGPQFWDGRAASLEEQAVGPIANPIEMGNTHEFCVATLKEVPAYAAQFEALFADGLTIDNVGKAIASFERALVTGPAPWDYYEQLKTFEDAYAADLEDLEWLKEEDPELLADYEQLQAAAQTAPISESAKRGGELFFSDRSGCTACHVGANFTDELYHNLGVGMEADEPDLGRFTVTNEDVDRGAFKTPTVRNVALTAPYMHDGSQATLAEVVDWYVKGGHPNPWLSDKVTALDLTEQEKADLVAFMQEGLTGELPNVETGRLP